MFGILCVDLGDEAVSSIQAMTNGKVITISKAKASLRRFIYLSEILRNAIKLSQHNFVIVRTSWVQELANADEDFIAGARALDRVFLRFGAVHLVSPGVFQKAVVKMGTLQSPRNDIIVGNDSDAVARAIEQVRLQRESQLGFALKAGITNLSGSPTAKTVLVGEQINPYLEFTHWPFFDDRDSAKFISLALEKSSVLESEIMWTNAIHTNESLVIKVLLSYRPALKVVALGNVAHEKLSNLGISHRRVAHPQYARRFDSNGNYDVVLEQAIKG
jgi:hypothetical protein